MAIVLTLVTAATGSNVRAWQTAVSIDGERFRINGQPTYAGLAPGALGRLMNARMVNSTFDDENPATRPAGFDPEANTTRFIDSMDQYKAKGILAFTLNLQGGYPGYEGAINSAFARDGSLKPAYVRRVARVIEAADANGLVIILGLFYQRQDQSWPTRAQVQRGMPRRGSPGSDTPTCSSRSPTSIVTTVRTARDPPRGGGSPTWTPYGRCIQLLAPP